MKKKSILLIIFCYSFILNAQNTIPLKGVTIGFGMGASHLFKPSYDYFLTPDADHTLQIQKLSRTSIVISSVLSIKLGHLSLQTQDNGIIRKQLLVSSNRTKVIPEDVQGFRALDSDGDPIDIRNSKPKFYERLVINIGLNLAEIASDNISFNKSIDGGIGLGCYLNEFVQVGAFFDMIRIRQLRDYIVSNYEGKSIPNGAENFNALDEKNNALFYNKYIPGISIKIILSVGNK